MIPSNWRKGEFLLDWSWAVRIPWGILLLFGGGIALARGFQITGLADWIGQQLVFFKGLPVPLLVLALCLLVTFMTELTSNVATATLFMPILAGTATALDISPELNRPWPDNRCPFLHSRSIFLRYAGRRTEREGSREWSPWEYRFAAFLPAWRADRSNWRRSRRPVAASGFE